MKRMQVDNISLLDGSFFARLIGFDLFLLLCCCDSIPHLFSSFGVLSFYTLVGALPAWPGLLIYAIMAASALPVCEGCEKYQRKKERETWRHLCFSVLTAVGLHPNAELQRIH
jgi:hypothetical protein